MTNTPPLDGGEHSGPLTLSDVYSSIVGDQHRPTKLPLVVAQDLEERFIRDGWPTGTIYGTEATLAAQYGVGRDVMREAVRVLEVRDVVRVRRGSQGGVAVGEPDDERVAVMVSGYAYLTGVALPEVLEAWCAIHVCAISHIGTRVERGEHWEPAVNQQGATVATSPARALATCASEIVERSGNTTLQYFSNILKPLLPELAHEEQDGPDRAWRRIATDLNGGRTEDAVDGARVLFGQIARATCARAEESGPWRDRSVPGELDELMTPALAVVRQFMSGIAPSDWAAGQRLGNEFDIAERLGIDRSVVRQAIRIMEAAETAVALPGRGRGLTTRRPTPAPLSRLICVNLASRHEPPDDALAAVDSLMIELAGAAAEKADPQAVSALDRLLDGLSDMTGNTSISNVEPIERLQYRLAGNELLSLFVGGAKAFASWSMTDEPQLPSWVMERNLESTRDVLRAIADGAVSEAMRLEARRRGDLARLRGTSMGGRP